MIRVYRYGLLPPIENAERIREQLRAAHNYRNKLTEIERQRRAEHRTELSSYGQLPQLEMVAAAAKTEATDAAKDVRAAKAKTRTAKVPKKLSDALKAKRAEKKTALKTLREARKELRLDADVQAKLDIINERAKLTRKAARAACGVYWGTYLMIEDADQAARKAPLYDGTEPNDPRFQRWTGEGAVGVQLQGGLPVPEFLAGGDQRIRIEDRSPPSGADPNSRRSAKRRYVAIALRIGSDEHRGPVWGRWPAVLHRPLPPAGLIKRAAVHLRKIGPREEWSLTITVDSDIHKRCGSGAVGIDLGWRVREDGLRVAMAYGQDDTMKELVLANRVASQIRKAEDLRSIRDQNFDKARAALLAGLAELPNPPEWLTEATKTLARWRSIARLASLTKRWRDLRFDADETLYDPLEAWRYHDFHLWEWEVNQRRKGIRHRREVYRIWGAKLARQYETLVIEDFDLRQIARDAKPEEARDNQTARSNRVLAATSELRGALKNAFTGRGGHVVTVPAVDTTRLCGSCGNVEHWDQANEVDHQCSQCGALWDQDENAAQNILAIGTEQMRVSALTPKKPTEKPSESRWVRAKRLRAEKEARMATAQGGAT